MSAVHEPRPTRSARATPRLLAPGARGPPPRVRPRGVRGRVPVAAPARSRRGDGARRADEQLAGQRADPAGRTRAGLSPAPVKATARHASGPAATRSVTPWPCSRTAAAAGGWPRARSDPLTGVPIERPERALDPLGSGVYGFAGGLLMSHRVDFPREGVARVGWTALPARELLRRLRRLRRDERRHASSRRRRRSPRRAPAASRSGAGRGWEPRSRPRAARRRCRRRSRAGVPRPDARHRRSAGSCRSRWPRGGRRPQPA